MRSEPPGIPTGAEIASEHDETRAAILAAAQRMLSGQPSRVPIGAMTLADLAREAGVDRHVLYEKHRDLKERFQQSRSGVPHSQGEYAELAERLARLRSEHSQLQDLQRRTGAEADHWRALAETLARAINVLQEELRREQLKAARLHRKLEQRGPELRPVTPIRSTPSV